jgi:hypothetical protein
MSLGSLYFSESDRLLYAFFTSVRQSVVCIKFEATERISIKFGVMILIYFVSAQYNFTRS